MGYCHLICKIWANNTMKDVACPSTCVIFLTTEFVVIQWEFYKAVSSWCHSLQNFSWMACHFIAMFVQVHCRDVPQFYSRANFLLYNHIIYLETKTINLDSQSSALPLQENNWRVKSLIEFSGFRFQDKIRTWTGIRTSVLQNILKLLLRSNNDILVC